MLMVTLAMFVVITDETGPVILAKKEAIFELVATPRDRLMKAPDDHFADIPIQRLFFAKYLFSLHVLFL